ncbi:MAG: minichromosome maintenance protein MCM [Methanospirillaceae archaeon]|nr:minichromosome maintenance protein MCM [Methanospirillaceae archaeon]
MDVELTDRDADWKRFLKARYKKELEEISREYPFRRSLQIDYHDIESYGRVGTQMADELLETPGKVIGDVRDCIRNHQLIILKKDKSVPLVNIRFVNLPKKISIRDIRSDHIGKFISIEGILRKITEVRPRITLAKFRCPSGHITSRVQGYGSFVEPDGCATDGCTHKKLELFVKLSEFVDSQKLRIQESPEGLRGGEQPQTLDVDLTDDLCGVVAPGDRVILHGILRSMQRTSYSTKSTIFDIYLECNSIEISEKEFAEVDIMDEDIRRITELASDPLIYRKVSKSIAPTVFGHDDVKLAIALQLFGGITKEMLDGTHLRGDIHILLIGDPGVAKSQMIRYVSRLAPRSIYTSGQSSTSAGLTATAVKDEFGDGRWTLEAGALVLADMGVACVDEMDKMNKHDRSSLHEAMEQQSISVAKAGITATLRSRCALLGAANPAMGRFDDNDPIADQINMPPSLLSRFDLLFTMTDKPHEEKDRAIANHILQSHKLGELIAQYTYNSESGVDESILEKEKKGVTPEIDEVLFRKYVAYAKRTCFPLLSERAREMLVNNYLTLREIAQQNMPVPITARQLEAIIRLAEASARIRLSPIIEESDADRAIHIINECLKNVAYDSKTGAFDIDRVYVKSKGKQDLIRTIKEIIKAGAKEKGHANYPEVVDAVIKLGYDEEDVKRQIALLKQIGEVLEPRRGLIRLL